eukprot:scaffold31200_cov150-Skeletonema_dohrnii-CCMP3373.AAC.3
MFAYNDERAAEKRLLYNYKTHAIIDDFRKKLSRTRLTIGVSDASWRRLLYIITLVRVVCVNHQM